MDKSEKPADLDVKIQAAELEKLQLEINRLKKPVSFRETLLSGLPLFSIAIALAGLLWGITKDYKSAFWEQQVDIYRIAVDTTSTIAVSDTSIDEIARKKATRDFWKLYYGEMSLIENKEVFDAMVEFGESLNSNNGSTELQQKSYQLALACRKSLGETWSPVSLGDLDKLKYHK